MALAEKRICEHTDATTISSADEFIVDSMANGTRNITMTNLENQILSTDTYSALTGIGDGTITGSIADIDSNLNNLTYDSTTNRLTMTGNTAFSGTIDSSPTAGSGNAVSSGGTKTYVDSAVSQLNDEIGDINDKLRGVYKLQVADFNSLPNGSIMQVYGSAAHAPGTSAHYYIVFTYFIAGTTTYKLQLAIENGVGSIYTRDCTNGTWGNWNKFATT